MQTELVKELSVHGLKDKFDNQQPVVILDVREDYELDISQFSSFIHIPLGDLSSRIDELNKRNDIVVICRTGSRSNTAAEYLSENGFDSVYNLVGGINQWAETIDPNMAIY